MTFIVVFVLLSLALFAYWFRYSCMLILRTQTAENFGLRFSRANGLSFGLVKVEFEQNLGSDLEKLYRSLDNDYRIVARLLGSVAPATPAESLLEVTLLRVNFRLTQCLFLASHKLGLGYTRKAIVEMTEMIEHFANTLGQQSATESATA
jgi:hypothetical protein